MQAFAFALHGGCLWDVVRQNSEREAREMGLSDRVVAVRRGVINQQAGLCRRHDRGCWSNVSRRPEPQETSRRRGKYRFSAMGTSYQDAMKASKFTVRDRR